MAKWLSIEEYHFFETLDDVFKTKSPLIQQCLNLFKADGKTEIKSVDQLNELLDYLPDEFVYYAEQSYDEFYRVVIINNPFKGEHPKRLQNIDFFAIQSAFEVFDSSLPCAKIAEANMLKSKYRFLLKDSDQISDEEYEELWDEMFPKCCGDDAVGFLFDFFPDTCYCATYLDPYDRLYTVILVPEDQNQKIKEEEND